MRAFALHEDTLQLGLADVGADLAPVVDIVAWRGHELRVGTIT